MVPYILTLIFLIAIILWQVYSQAESFADATTELFTKTSTVGQIKDAITQLKTKYETLATAVNAKKFTPQVTETEAELRSILDEPPNSNILAELKDYDTIQRFVNGNTNRLSGILDDFTNLLLQNPNPDDTFIDARVKKLQKVSMYASKPIDELKQMASVDLDSIKILVDFYAKSYPLFNGIYMRSTSSTSTSTTTSSSTLPPPPPTTSTTTTSSSTLPPPPSTSTTTTSSTLPPPPSTTSTTTIPTTTTTTVPTTTTTVPTTTTTTTTPTSSSGPKLMINLYDLWGALGPFSSNKADGTITTTSTGATSSLTGGTVTSTSKTTADNATAAETKVDITKANGKPVTCSQPAAAVEESEMLTKEIEERLSKNIAKQIKDELVSQYQLQGAIDDMCPYAPSDLGLTNEGINQGAQFQQMRPYLMAQETAPVYMKQPKINMNDYIRKDSIPCAKCNLSS